MIKIAIIDDHPLIVKGISQLFEQQDDIDYVGTAQDGKKALELIDLIAPDMILLDIDLPNMNGLDILRHYKSRNSDLKIIIISVHEEIPIIKKTMQLGADGYLLKKSSPEDIISAVHMVARNQKYFSTEVTLSMLNAQKDKTVNSSNLSKYSLLTAREKEVANLIVDGKTNTQISQHLHISKRTVDTHRNNLMQKLELRGAVDLVKFVLHNNL